jgi:hypothetical protein
MSDSAKLPPSVGRAIPSEFGGVKELLRRYLNIDEPVTGGVDPLADRGLEENDYREAVESLGLPDNQATRSVYKRLRRRLLYDFELGRENELDRPGGDPATPTRAFEKRVPPRLTIEENRALSEFIREEIEADHFGIYLGDRAASGAILHETPLGTKRESGPVQDLDPLPFEPKPSDHLRIHLGDHTAAGPILRETPFGTMRESGPILDSNPLPFDPKQSDVIETREPKSLDDSVWLRETEADLDSRVSLTAAAPSPTLHTYSMSIRPGERKTQVIELPGLTLELVISMPSMLPRPA